MERLSKPYRLYLHFSLTIALSSVIFMFIEGMATEKFETKYIKDFLTNPAFWVCSLLLIPLGIMFDKYSKQLYTAVTAENADIEHITAIHKKRKIVSYTIMIIIAITYYLSFRHTYPSFVSSACAVLLGSLTAVTADGTNAVEWVKDVQNNITETE